tara:strand:- start:599 stop:2047 length:1449 start_codon:yes stop_codon:yes gene_type:complete
MKKKITLLAVTMTLMSFAQIQLGADIMGGNGDAFGGTVSSSNDGTILAAAATWHDTGYVRVFKYLNSSWSPLGDTIFGDAYGDDFGFSISLSDDGTILAIGAPQEYDSTGYVRVYEYSGSSWSQLGADIDGEAAADESGYSVSLSDDGTILAIGAIGYDLPGYTYPHGQVKVYKYLNGNWSQLGADLIGLRSTDGWGTAVSLSGDGTILAITAPSAGAPLGTSLNDQGTVAIFGYSNGNWSAVGDTIYGQVNGEGFGSSVSLSDDGSIIAVSLDNSVRVYDYSGSNWTQLGADIDGDFTNDNFGRSISLSDDGTIFATGAPENSNSRGYVKVYEYSGSNWTQLGANIDGDFDDDMLGYSVSLSGDGGSVAIGAPFYGIDSTTLSGYYFPTYSGVVRIYATGVTTIGIPENKSDLIIWPNPTRGFIHLDLVSPADFMLYSLTGQIVKKGTTEAQINISQLPAGRYQLQLIVDGVSNIYSLQKL